MPPTFIASFSFCTSEWYPPWTVCTVIEVIGLIGIFQDSLISLLPRVVELVGDHGIPIIAAGGIVDEHGYVAALALGAQGIALGTRYVKFDNSEGSGGSLVWVNLCEDE